jgi:hypothetical protein
MDPEENGAPPSDVKLNWDLGDATAQATPEPDPIRNDVTTLELAEFIADNADVGNAVSPPPSAMSLDIYDNIGDSCTKDDISAYLANHKFGRPVNMTVLHNSGTPAGADKGLATVKSFHEYHVNVRKWKCIGYHFVIDTKGIIWAARKMDYLGAHAGSQGNPNSIGVCLVGNFEAGDKPTQVQKEAFAALHSCLHKQFYGSASNRVRFHREFMSTGCPGNITVDEVMQWISVYGTGVSGGTADKPLVIVNGKSIGSGVVIGGQTFVPVRVVAESLGMDVQWKGDPDFEVILTSKA